MREKIIVGISGGVDSAVTALLLKEQGYDVEGLFMFNWAEDEDGYCNAADDFQSARAVCNELNIPLHRADFSKEYRERVFDNFLAEHRAGRTPNPDILCNREIKFAEFLRYARRLGASRIATGHYAGVETHGDETWLMRAADENKDQTYFLIAVPESALRHTLFPLASLEKPQVRMLAARAGLPNYARKDSTGICFVGERPMREFLSRYLDSQPGPICSLDDAANTRLGEHVGLVHYTLGQRRGIGVGGQRVGVEAAWYVVEKDAASNTLWVSQQADHPRLLSHQVRIAAPHWIGTAVPEGSHIKARIRHRQSLQDCIVGHDISGYLLTFSQPQRAVTPGQYAALYDGRRCLGGAVMLGAST